MKKFLISIMLALSATAMVVDAYAKPMGGGRNIGRQSPTAARQAAAPPQAAPNAAAAAAPRPGMAPVAPVRPPSPWKGILGGALLGLGLGALFAHFGMGAGMASAISSMLMIGLLIGAAYLIYRLIRSRSQPAMQPAMQPAYQGYTHENAVPEIGSRLEPHASYDPHAAYAPVQPVMIPANPYGLPVGFDSAGFLRQCKSSFLRMQAAWDKGDVADLRNFTSPEMFAELRLQISERGANTDFTDVVSIEAELLGIEVDGTEQVASVKFTGLIKQAANAPAEPFNEVWNMVRPVHSEGAWMLAGIQQLQ